MLFLKIVAIVISLLYSMSSLFYATTPTVNAQSDLQTIKYRNLVIDLGNGVKTNAQLTIPAVGNVTFNDLKQDAEKALAVLAQQPEVDPNRITIIGHSEGGVITSRVAIDNPDKVKNIVLMGSPILNLIKDSAYITFVHLPILYAQNVLDKNHSGLISVKEASEDPIFQGMVLDNSTLFIGHSNITGIDSAVNDTKSANGTNISINNELKPRLERQFEQYINELNTNTNQSRILDERCSFNIFKCPIWAKSHLLLTDTLSVIGNVS